MVSTRQRRVKRRRAERKKEWNLFLKVAPEIVKKIREESFRSMPECIGKLDYASPSRDDDSRNPEGDMPGQVGVAITGRSGSKDAYEHCFPEDLEWANKVIKSNKQ